MIWACIANTHHNAFDDLFGTCLHLNGAKHEAKKALSVACIISIGGAVQLGLARTICIRCIYGIFGREITGKSPNIRSYTVYLYGSGQP